MRPTLIICIQFNCLFITKTKTSFATCESGQLFGVRFRLIRSIILDMCRLLCSQLYWLSEAESLLHMYYPALCQGIWQSRHLTALQSPPLCCYQYLPKLAEAGHIIPSSQTKASCRSAGISSYYIPPHPARPYNF